MTKLTMKKGNSPGIVLYDEDGKPVLTVHAKTRCDIFSGKGADIIYEKDKTIEFAQQIIEALNG
jgi:hypothetical protein